MVVHPGLPSSQYLISFLFLLILFSLYFIVTVSNDYVMFLCFIVLSYTGSRLEWSSRPDRRGINQINKQTNKQTNHHFYKSLSLTLHPPIIFFKYSVLLLATVLLRLLAHLCGQSSGLGLGTSPAKMMKAICPMLTVGTGNDERLPA